MKVAQLLEQRRQHWRELEQLCEVVERRKKRSLGAESVSRFGALYRSACADLALADAYQLPPNTIEYLHQLVARAHNQLYRGRQFSFGSWLQVMFVDAPQRLFQDNCLRLAFLLFWGVFIASMFLAATSREYAEAALGKDMMLSLEQMYAQPLAGRGLNEDTAMFGFYVQHNASIGLRCFAAGLVLGIVGLVETIYNAGVLGAAFGYMTTVPAGPSRNFFQFVTAHGPFELSAIVLSAAAGMRLGFSIIFTGGLTRSASMRKAGSEAMPTVCAAILLFAGAAVIEGFISPSALPYPFKVAVAVFTSGLMMFYFVMLGYPRRGGVATR